MTENNALNNAVFNKGKILVVDDNPKNLRFLSEMLTAQDYDVHQAISGEVALNYLQSNQPDLVLLDICMPGMNGYEVCKQLKATEKSSRIPVIFISALTDTQVKLKAFEAGGLDYVTKPFQFEEVLARVNTQISMSRMQKKLADHNIHLKSEIERRKKAELSLQKAYDDIEIKVEQRTAELKKALEGTITAVAKAVEARDLYVAGHQRRVATLACAIANEMGLTTEQIEGIYMGAMIHDIGKIHLPAEILGKPAHLLEAEFTLVKSHPKVGFEILEDIDFPWPVAEIAHQHHEHLDGSGYPQGLTGNEILLEARIVCVADVVEAMACHRPYRPALGIDRALEEIEKNSGVFYDQVVVAACLRLFFEKQFVLEIK